MAESEMVLTVEMPALDPQACNPEQQSPREPRSFAGIIASRIEALKSYHAAVLATEEVEAIHKMRVTTRRLQAALDLLGRDGKVRSMKRRLRRWRRRLSEVRNYDVFLMLLEKEAQGRRSAHREQFEFVRTMLQKRRARRAAKAKIYLDKIDINIIASRLGLKVTEPAANAGDAVSIDNHEANDDETRQATAVVSGYSIEMDQSKITAYAADRLDQRLAEFQALAVVSHPTTDPVELHQLRIAAKRVRYLLETVSEMGYGNAPRALGWLKRLQDRIGDWHDLHALEEEIIEIVSRRRFMKEHLAESSRMLEAAAHLQKKKEALMAKLFPVRVPRTLVVSSQRITRALRRDGLRGQPSAKHSRRRKEAQSITSAESKARSTPPQIE